MGLGAVDRGWPRGVARVRPDGAFGTGQQAADLPATEEDH